MLEKKISFKSHFARYYTFTIKNLYDIMINIDGEAEYSLDTLSKKVNAMNAPLENQEAFAYIGDAVRFSFHATSRGCKSILGYPAADWTRKGIPFFIENFCFADVESNEQMFKRIMEHLNSLAIEQKPNYVYTSTFRFYHKNGHFVWLQSKLIFHSYDKKGKLLHSVDLFTKLDNYKHDDSCWLQIAKVDPLTGQHQIEETIRYKPYGLNDLNTIEIEILKLLSLGMDNEAIAQQLALKESTIKSYRKGLLKKTWCSNTVELVYYAIRNGLIE